MLHVAALLLPLPALGLRMEPRPIPHSMWSTRGQALPDLLEFDKKWRALAQQEPSEVVPVRGVRLLLGVFTTRQEAMYCRIIRETWMNRAGVCKASQGPQKKCSVYVTFVEGASTEEAPEAEHDIMALKIQEGMNNGKSFAFFRNASFAYPWATHYAKVDSDAYPHLTVILSSLRGRPGCEAYLGKPWVCPHPENGCPSLACGPPVDGDFLRYAGHIQQGKCWCYMQGGLYIISRGLLQSALEGDYWQNHSIGFEDVLTGRAIAEAAYSKNLCVDTWTNRTLLNRIVFHFHEQGTTSIFPKDTLRWRWFWGWKSPQKRLS